MKNKGAMLLLSLGKKGKEGYKEEKEEESSESSVRAAQALLDAIESGDAEAVDEALKLHYTMCEHE